MKRLEADIGGPLVYADYGGEGKPPAVLLHGIGGAKVNWMLLAPMLAARLHVLALDLPGFGESPLAGRSAGLDDQRDVVAAFLERVVGAPALVVGHSMGGLIAALVAAGRPDLVRGIVLFAPAFPPTDSPAPGLPSRVLDRMAYAPAIAGRLGQALMQARGARTVVVETLQRTSADFAALPATFVEAHVEAERERMRRPGAYVGYMQGWRWFHTRFKDVPAMEAAIRSITVPAILIQGTLDRVVLPQAGRRLAEIQPAWTAHFMDGIGHNPNFEAPRESAELIWPWLDSLPQP